MKYIETFESWKVNSNSSDPTKEGIRMDSKDTNKSHKKSGKENYPVEEEFLPGEESETGEGEVINDGDI